MAGVRELDGVSQQVEHDLANPARVTDKAPRGAGCIGQEKFQTLFVSRRGHQLEQVLQGHPQVERHLVNVNVAGFNF